MNSVQHIPANQSSFQGSTFSVRFKKALLLELKYIFSTCMIFFAYISSLGYGVYVFLTKFEIMKSIFGVLTPVFVVYMVGMYLTLIPPFFVYVLICSVVFGFWKKYLYPTLGAVVFFSFFISLLV